MLARLIKVQNPNELRIYNPNGNLKEISNWRMDKANGLFIRYFKDGKIRQRGVMKNAEKTGDWILND